MQREESIALIGRVHGDRHQPDIRLSGRRHHEHLRTLGKRPLTLSWQLCRRVVIELGQLASSEAGAVQSKSQSLRPST